MDHILTITIVLWIAGLAALLVGRHASRTASLSVSAMEADTTPRPAGGAADGPPPIPHLGPAPGLPGLDGWLQSDVTSLEELRGKVVVVQFWTFGCHNCLATIPHLRALYDAHGGGTGDLEIVGVHAPEFVHERDIGAITWTIAEEGVTWPVALDTNLRNFRGWQPGRTSYWPRTFVLDREGEIRFDHVGEGAYDELNHTVERLLTDPEL